MTKVQIIASRELPGISEALKHLRKRAQELEFIRDNYLRNESEYCLTKAGVVLGETQVRLFYSPPGQNRTDHPLKGTYIAMRVLHGGKVEFARSLKSGKPSSNRTFVAYEDYFEIVPQQELQNESA